MRKSEPMAMRKNMRKALAPQKRTSRGPIAGQPRTESIMHALTSHYQLFIAHKKIGNRLLEADHKEAFETLFQEATLTQRRFWESIRKYVGAYPGTLPEAFLEVEVERVGEGAHLQCRVPKDLHDRLSEVCRAMKKNMGTVVANMLRDALPQLEENLDG